MSHTLPLIRFHRDIRACRQTETMGLLRFPPRPIQPVCRLSLFRVTQNRREAYVVGLRSCDFKELQLIRAAWLAAALVMNAMVG